MRAGSKACAADVADHLPLAHPAPLSDSLRKTRHVQILGLIHLIVFDFDEISIALGVTFGNDHTIAHSIDGGAGWRCIICPQVGPHPFQHGVITAGIVA